VRKHHEYGGSLRRVRRQANGLAYASTLGWMQVEPQQRNAHPTKDHNGSMNLPTSVAERVNRDADFTSLRQSVRQGMKVIYIRGTGDPHQLADLVLSHIGHCLTLLEEHNVVVLDEDGCHTTL
jgi:hypothetical protein